MKNTGKHLALWGTALTLTLLLGPAATVYGLFRTVSEMVGEARAEVLASHMNISIALYATMAGIVLAHIGGVLLLIALCGTKYRAPWFEIAMWAVACFWMLSAFVCMMGGSEKTSPDASTIAIIDATISALAGIAVMIYLAKHNREFAAQPAEPQLTGS